MPVLARRERRCLSLPAGKTPAVFSSAIAFVNHRAERRHHKAPLNIQF
jgi:hypothetical protein